MTEKIKIGCPNCGSVLLVAEFDGMETRFVTCPICKARSPFTAFQRMDDGGDALTQYGGRPALRQQFAGMLTDAATGRRYFLQKGRNIIGREAPTSKATVRLPCTDKKMSREHLFIDVDASADALTHRATLAKSRVNPTRINNTPIEYGDSVLLQSGDIIELPGCELHFTVSEKGTTP